MIIRYTLNRNNPYLLHAHHRRLLGGSVKGERNFTVIDTLKEKAFKAGMYDSGVATGNYTGTVTGNAAPTDVVITGPTYPQPCGRHHLHRHVQRRRGAGGVQPHQDSTRTHGCTAEHRAETSTASGTPTSFTWTYNATLTAGSYTLYAKATDAGGLISAASAVYNYTASAAAPNTPSTADTFIPSALTAVRGNAVYATWHGPGRGGGLFRCSSSITTARSGRTSAAC